MSLASQGKPENQGWRVLPALPDKPAALANQANRVLPANLVLPASLAQPGRRQASPDDQ